MSVHFNDIGVVAMAIIEASLINLSTTSCWKMYFGGENFDDDGFLIIRMGRQVEKAHAASLQEAFDFIWTNESRGGSKITRFVLRGAKEAR